MSSTVQLAKRCVNTIENSWLTFCFQFIFSQDSLLSFISYEMDLSTPTRCNIVSSSLPIQIRLHSYGRVWRVNHCHIKSILRHRIRPCCQRHKSMYLVLVKYHKRFKHLQFRCIAQERALPTLMFPSQLKWCWARWEIMSVNSSSPERKYANKPRNSTRTNRIANYHFSLKY